MVGEACKTGVGHCRAGCYRNYSQNIGHAVEIVKVSSTVLILWQCALLGAKYNASSEPVVTYDYQNTQYSGSTVVDTPSEKINVSLENHNFYHESKSSTYVANGNTFKIEYSSDQVSDFTPISL